MIDIRNANSSYHGESKIKVQIIFTEKLCILQKKKKKIHDCSRYKTVQ